MASSTQLSECVAKQLGLPELTIALHMRNIREAGLITQGGARPKFRKNDRSRRRSLAGGFGWQPESKDSVEVIGKYASIGKTKGSNWATGLVPKLDQLRNQHTFAEALTALIESGMANDLPIKNRDQTNLEAILITLFWPWSGAKIEFYKFDEAKDVMKAVEPHWLTYGAGFFLAPSSPPITPQIISKADFQQERKFTHRTIFALANLLKELRNE